jgi:hypothetical protein
MTKQYEKRDAAFEAYVIGSLNHIGYIQASPKAASVVRATFNAGWEARKRAEYETMIETAQREPDEDTLDREDALEAATGPLSNPAILEAVNEPVKNLTAAQITALVKLGWTFMTAWPDDKWRWTKLISNRRVAIGGDEIWKRDVAAVCRRV